jgi:hypothetical protein
MAALATALAKVTLEITMVETAVLRRAALVMKAVVRARTRYLRYADRGECFVAGMERDSDARAAARLNLNKFARAVFGQRNIT